MSYGTQELRAALLKRAYLDKLRTRMKGTLDEILKDTTAQMQRDWHEQIYPAVFNTGVKEETKAFTKSHGRAPTEAERRTITNTVNRMIYDGLQKTLQNLHASAPQELAKTDRGQRRSSRKTEALNRVLRSYGGEPITITPPPQAYRHRMPSTRAVLHRMNRGGGRTLDDIKREHEERMQARDTDTRYQPAKTMKRD